MVVRARNPSAQELEAGGLEVQGQCQLQQGALRPVWDTGDTVSKKRGVLVRWLNR